MDLLTPSSPQKVLGISCTATAFHAPKWAKAHTARKVIVHRDFTDINYSLASIGLPPLDPTAWSDALGAIDGFHVSYRDIFARNSQTLRKIWEHLFPELHFDAQRTHQLKAYSVQPHFDLVQWRPEIGQRLMGEVNGQ